MNKTVLITGASSGIGKATAKTLKNKGYTVYGAARRVERMQEIKDEGICILEIDVTNEESIQSGVQQIIEAEGSVDILINNAGYGEYGPIEQVDLSDARYQLDVNLFGAARLIQLVLPGMRENGWGKIINVSSIGGKLANPFGGWYHVSKFGLEALSDSLRNEVRQFGIDVVVIEPGGIETEWGDIAVDNMMEYATEDSPYEDAIKTMGEALRGANSNAASPQVIADVMLEALKKDEPKARYHAGFMAEEMLSAHKNMSDKELDEMIRRQFGS